MDISPEEQKARLTEYCKGNPKTAFLTEDQLWQIAKEAEQIAQAANIPFISVFDNLVFIKSVTERKIPDNSL